MNQELLKGNIAKSLFIFALPFLLANLLQALYGAFDLMIVSWYCSKESIAAVSTGTQVTQIITSLISGLSLGGTILVGKYVGMKKEKAVVETIATTFILFSIVAIILTIVMICFSENILIALKTPLASFEQAKTYVLYCSYGIFFISGYNALSAVLRGYGDSRRPLLFVAIACVINIFGDIYFIKILNMGVAGAAFATCLSQAVSMICAIISLKRQNFIFQFRLSQFQFEKEKAWQIIKISFPISLQELATRFSFLYLTSITNQFGVIAASAVGIASKYDVFAMLPATSIGSALAAFVAQNIGAKQFSRANSALKIGIIMALPLSMCFFLWAQINPQSMIGLFTQDSSIIQAGIPFFRVCSIDYLSVVFLFSMTGYLNGQEKTLFTMMSNGFGALVLRVPLAYFFSQLFPHQLLFMGAIAPMTSITLSIISFVYVQRFLQIPHQKMKQRKLIIGGKHNHSL